MTIHADGRDRIIECEQCANTDEIFDKDDFEIMIMQAKERGWKVELVDRVWTHTCPSCKAGDRLAAARKKFGA